MPRIVVNPQTPQAREILLKPGLNFLGRGPSNDFRFDDPSISGAHCQVLVDSGGVTIRDMGSTNGTFVNRARVQESRLTSGQPLRLGSVEMIFYADESAARPAVPVATLLSSAAPPPPPPAAPLQAPPLPPALTVSPVPISIPPHAPAPVLRVSDAPPAPAPAPALKITGLHAPAPVPTATAETDLMAPPVPEMAETSQARVIDVGARFCKFHPKSPARYLCKKCNRTFCEVCVSTLNVGGKAKKNCRSCQVECIPVQVHLEIFNAPTNFFKVVPGSFAYPFRGSGIFGLLLMMLAFAGIMLGNMMFIAGIKTGSFRSIGMGIIILMLVGGYLFTFLQNIIHATASGENEIPDLPGVNFLEDILLPFCRLLGLVLVCFAPAVVMIIIALATASPTAAIGILPAVLLGCVYFPMAYLAVAILDSVGAVNPLAVIPSILKVPGEYILTVIILAVVMIFTRAGDMLVDHFFPNGLSTTSIPELLGMFGVKLFWSFVDIYLLAVMTRILGLLYLCKKDKLGWIGR